MPGRGTVFPRDSATWCANGPKTTQATRFGDMTLVRLGYEGPSHTCTPISLCGDCCDCSEFVDACPKMSKSPNSIRPSRRHVALARCRCECVDALRYSRQATNLTPTEILRPRICVDMPNAIYRMVKAKSRDECYEGAQNGDILRKSERCKAITRDQHPNRVILVREDSQVTQGGQIFRPLGLCVGNHLLCKHNKSNKERK